MCVRPFIASGLPEVGKSLQDRARRIHPRGFERAELIVEFGSQTDIVLPLVNFFGIAERMHRAMNEDCRLTGPASG